MDAEQIAQVCHEANRAYCKALGDHSHQEWDNAPEWQRKSAIAGVKAVLGSNVQSSMELHENWMKDKIADGWVYGEEKNVEKKTHPSLRPYDELPAEERLKDMLFLNIIRALSQ